MTKRDPLQTLVTRLTQQKLVDGETFDRIVRDVKTEIDKGTEFALAAPYPSPEQVTEDVDIHRSLPRLVTRVVASRLRVGLCRRSLI